MNKLTNLLINKLTKKMQNEPKFKNAQMNISACNRSGYSNFLTFFHRKNEPKRTQNEPNFKNDIMNVTPLLARSSDDFRTFSRRKNKPKRTQNEPNFSLKLASFYYKINAFAKKLNLSKYRSEVTDPALDGPKIRRFVRCKSGTFLTERTMLNNKYFYFTCCIFRLLCYNASKWRFNLSSLKSKPPTKNSVRDNIIIGL